MPHAERGGLDDWNLIARAWARWGRDCTNHLLGDYYAFAVWNRRVRTLFCARGHVGVRPFYYAETARGFVFVSAVEAVLAAFLMRALATCRTNWNLRRDGQVMLGYVGRPVHVYVHLALFFVRAVVGGDAIVICIFSTRPPAFTRRSSAGPPPRSASIRPAAFAAAPQRSSSGPCFAT